jgi:hypothetical protein
LFVVPVFCFGLPTAFCLVVTRSLSLSLSSAFAVCVCVCCSCC